MIIRTSGHSFIVETLVPALRNDDGPVWRMPSECKIDPYFVSWSRYQDLLSRLINAISPPPSRPAKIKIRYMRTWFQEKFNHKALYRLIPLSLEYTLLDSNPLPDFNPLPEIGLVALWLNFKMQTHSPIYVLSNKLYYIAMYYYWFIINLILFLSRPFPFFQ